MARVIRIFKALRNNPKKTVFFSIAGTFLAKFAKDKYEEEQLMASYCREASQYGEQTHIVGQPFRHITVLLNPAAAGGKCKAKFEKYCAPLLHLAGLKVAVVRTEHQGQARDLMALMEKTDGVVVAGGDGTLSEVLTGLLRREDNAAARLPLSVLPLGTDSTVGRAVWGVSAEPEPQHLLEATMAVVRQVLAPMDVMEVTPHTAPTEPPAKPIFTNVLEWGAYRDAWERRDKYWYYATLKRYMTFLFSSYKDLSWDCSCSLSYTEPCNGCSNCHVAPPPLRWYQALVHSLRHHKPTVDYSAISNPECGLVKHATLERVCDVRVSTRNTPATQHLESNQLLVQSGVADTSTWEFISEGWRRQQSGKATNDRQLTVGSVTVTPTGSVKNKEGEEREFFLDGESYEVKPVTIRARPRAVTIFSPSPRTPIATA